MGVSDLILGIFQWSMAAWGCMTLVVMVYKFIKE